jgi:hypothetical protein
MRSAYRGPERRTPVRARRILLVLEQPDIEAVDAWAVPAGLPSRSDALRALVRRGLKAERAAEKRRKA